MMLRRMFGAAGLIFGLTASGCVTDSNSIYVLGVSSQSGSCEYSTSSFLTSTVIDPSASTGVTVGLVVGNLIRKRNLTISNDPSQVLIREAEIQVFDANNTAIGPAFVTDVSSSIIPGSSNGQTPGLGVVAVEILPPQILSMIPVSTQDVTVTAHITLRGETLGKIDVEGGVFTFVATITPPGDLGIDCTATMASVAVCCSPGVNTPYCTDAVNDGNCVSQ